MRNKVLFIAVLCLLLSQPIGAGIGSLNPECFELLDLLANLEGLDYSKIDIAKRLFGDEKINFEIETWRGKCNYGIGTLDGKVVVVSNKPFKNPTLLAFSDSKTVKILFKEPSEKLFEEALKTGKIRIEGVGVAEKTKVGLTNVLSKYVIGKGEGETLNTTLTALNFPGQNDYDGDGILNSEDVCDPYMMKEGFGADPFQDTLPLVKYYTCPSSVSVYTGNAPYLDIYDYVMENGCGVKDTDGGVRYYSRGSIYIENVSYSPPAERLGAIRPGEVKSECKKVYTDYCLDDKTLVEYYYETPKKVVSSYFNPITKRMEVRVTWTSGGVKNKTYICPLGCKDGACIAKDVDSTEWDAVSPYVDENGEVRYGFNPWSKGYYGADAIAYVVLRTGKDVNDIRSSDFFKDECIGQKTLREYYVTVQRTWGPLGRVEDRLVIKSEDYTCPHKCELGKCVPEHCFDGVKNHDESGVDCGGPCYPCRPNNVCTQTSARYVPPDTPCDDKWRPGKRTMKCEVYEVCTDELDYIVEEAYRCAEYIVDSIDISGFDRELCSHTKDVISQELSINLRMLDEFESKKLVAGVYIVEGLGDPSFNAGWMNYYLHEEFCCHNVTGGSNSLCWRDVASCLKNNSAQPSNFWNMMFSCLSQSDNARERSRLQLYQGYLRNITQMVCDERRVDRVWLDDTQLSRNSIYYSVPPTHAIVNIMRTGTCADYSSAVVTLLRKAGYTCDEVFSVTYPGHVWNVVKFPGMNKWVVVDTTGGDRGGISTRPPSKKCSVFNKTANLLNGWCVKYLPYNDSSSPHYCARPLSNDCTNIYREVVLGEKSTYGRPADDLIRSEKDVLGCG